MIKLTAHCAKRVAERKIPLAWIENAIIEPDWAGPDSDLTLTQSYKAIAAFGSRILKVVHRPDGDDLLVVTAYFDRGASR